MNISHDTFTRLLLRCLEISKQPGINPAILGVYKDTLEAPANEYLGTDAAVNASLIAFEKENSEAFGALSSLDGPYKVARSALRAIYPSTAKAAPLTLKSLPTDTDKLKAIQWLLDSIQGHAGEAWADAILAGEYGVSASKSITEVEEAIAANKAYTKAKMDRADAAVLAYSRFIDFRQLVREACGAGSKEYQRLHLRGSSPKDEPEADSEGEASAPLSPPTPNAGPADA